MTASSPHDSPGPSRRRASLFTVAAIVITLYGGLLRYEALVVNYGSAGQPAWSEALGQRLVPVARALRPDEIVWWPVPHPYVGGDPINYIRYAREMRHFYQAHVREPVFLAVTKMFLWLCEGRDIAVSFASVLGGTLAIFATYLLGAAVVSPIVGIAAALALAIELQAITWSADGWRDDTFMLFVALSAWSLIVLQERPSARSGFVAGLAAAGASLTRITALSFIVPALAWIVFRSPEGTRTQARKAVAVASLIWLAVAGPYLFNCWRTFGDPFYAINYHARYYRHAEGLPADDSVGALGYAATKLISRPIATIDTAAQGLITVPFFNKWQGWEAWGSAVGPTLQWCGAIGTLAALWSPRGRLLVLILITSLVPYALTWSLGGGGEWRFTQHVYPIYLVLAFQAIYVAIGFVAALVRRKAAVNLNRRDLVRAGGLLAVALVVWGAYALAPLLIAREALAAGDTFSITAGQRDDRFFDGAWSAPIDYGNVSVRVAQAELVGIRLPLADRPYVMTLRIDPALTSDPGRQPRLTVFLNKQKLTEIDLVRDPARMGSYRVSIPREIVKPLSRLDLMASHTVTAEEAGTPFVSLPNNAPVAFRLWYLRLAPEKF